MADQKVAPIRISEIPICIQGDRPDISIREWLSALDPGDGYFTETDFTHAKRHMGQGHSLRRFASFGQFREFLDQYISSQMCTPACMEEVPPPYTYQEGPEGLQAARICPEVPPLPAVPKPPKPKSPPIAAKEEPKEEPRKYYEEGLPWKKNFDFSYYSPPLAVVQTKDVQNSDGTYRRYDDGGVTLRNPELGPYPLAEGVRVDDNSPLDEEKNKPRGLKSSGELPFLDTALAGARDISGKEVDTVFVIDTSGSMEESVRILVNNLLDIKNGMFLGGAKEVYFGAVIFRDHPLSEHLHGIEVLAPLNKMRGGQIFDLQQSLLEVRFGGGKEPVGLAVKKAVGLLSSSPDPDKDAALRQKQIVVISDHEGLETACGDLAYAAEDRFSAVRRWAMEKGISVSVFLINNGIGCGCTENCIDG